MDITREINFIGWDVGGWHGKKNAFCILTYDGNKIEFKKNPEILQKNQIRNFFKEIIESNSKVILAIDAPLGLPIGFVDLLTSDYYNLDIEDDYFKNPYGFRETDMHIRNLLGKNPISPTFDKLTNNITLALCMRRELTNQGFKFYPFDSAHNNDRKIALEVYPGIFKNQTMKNGVLEQLINKTPSVDSETYFNGSLNYYLKGEKKLKTDEVDSFICALLALCFYMEGKDGFPLIERKINPDENIRMEGWIYYPKELELNYQKSNATNKII